MDKIYGVLLTLITGLFFLIGGLVSVKVKNKDKLNYFSVALAFVIIINLIIVDLFPEIFELLEEYKLYIKIGLSVLFIILGILILKILDMFIPDHHHEHHEDEKNIEEHKGHIKHIGTLTVISLILHNIIEGFAIFGLSVADFKVGLLTCISVALHNIPLGTHIFTSLSLKNNKLLISILALSSLIGGLAFLLVGELSNIILAVIVAITLGMLIYIAVIELLPDIFKSINQKETKLGLLTGLIIAAISLFI